MTTRTTKTTKPETLAQRLRAQRLCPGGVPRYVRIYDGGDALHDRYTVVFSGRYAGRPVGCWEHLSVTAGGGTVHGGAILSGPTWTAEADAKGSTAHLGKRVQFADLPEPVRAAILGDYFATWAIGPCRSGDPATYPVGRATALRYAQTLAADAQAATLPADCRPTLAGIPYTDLPWPQFGTLTQVRAASEATSGVEGGLWFSRETMKFHGTRIPPRSEYLLAGRYFVTNDKDAHGARGWTIRAVLPSGRIHTVGVLAGYGSRREAEQFIRAVVGVARGTIAPETAGAVETAEARRIF